MCTYIKNRRDEFLYLKKCTQVTMVHRLSCVYSLNYYIRVACLYTRVHFTNTELMYIHYINI